MKWTGIILGLLSVSSPTPRVVWDIGPSTTSGLQARIVSTRATDVVWIGIKNLERAPVAIADRKIVACSGSMDGRGVATGLPVDVHPPSRVAELEVRHLILPGETYVMAARLPRFGVGDVEVSCRVMLWKIAADGSYRGDVELRAGGVVKIIRTRAKDGGGDDGAMAP